MALETPTPAPTARPALALAHSDWHFHHLRVSGPAAQVTAFRREAAGAGVIPWYLDLDRMEEDFFLRLVTSRRLSLDGARLLAVELRDAVARRHAVAVARVGHSAACAFDLHALVPVPQTILRLGPDHPEGLAWLAAHWGTTQALRHVSVPPAAAPRRTVTAGDTVFAVTFWSADWTPWQALAAVRDRWTALRFDVTPRYDLA